MDTEASTAEPSTVNPATGLLMVGGIGGLDMAGNPFGCDLHQDHDPFPSSSLFDDPWDAASGTFSSSWDDGCSTDSSWNSSCGTSWDD
jgi:hypothetical protein